MNAPWRPSLLRITLLSSILFSSAAFLAAEEPDAPSVSVEKGREAYGMYCLACHGAEDAGIDSPSNLFDKKWYHGETRDQVENTIRTGLMEKGMPAWGQMISDQEIGSVIEYLFSFQTDKKDSDE